MMDDAYGEIDDAPRLRLYRLVARLLRTHELPDRMVRETAETEREMGTVSDALLSAQSDAEHALLALEAEVLDAAYAVIAADRRTQALRDRDGQV